MKKQPLFFVFLITSSLLFSCKKEKDTEAPFVSFISPLENQQFTVSQSIPVKFTIKDNVSIDYAQVGITDDSGISMVSTITFNQPENGQTISLDLPIDNLSLASGNYYLTVRASDGSNQKNYFVKVAIQELPTRRLAIYAFTKSSGGTSIYSFDSTYQQKFEKLLNGDFLGSGIHSGTKQLIACGAATGKLQAFSLIDWGSNWSENPVGTSYPCFRAFCSTPDYSIVGYNAGFIKAYSPSGSIACNATCDAGVFYPKQLAASGNYLLSEQLAFTGTTRKLVLYNFPSGNAIQEMVFNGEVVAMLPAIDGDFFVFYNHNAQAMISRYSRLSNGFSYTYPSAFATKVFAAAALSESVFMLATNSGIYRFNYNPQNLVLFKAAVQANVLNYDHSRSELIAGIGKKLNVYDINSGLLLESKLLSDSIADVELLYSR